MPGRGQGPSWAKAPMKRKKKFPFHSALLQFSTWFLISDLTFTMSYTSHLPSVTNGTTYFTANLPFTLAAVAVTFMFRSSNTLFFAGHGYV